LPLFWPSPFGGGGPPPLPPLASALGASALPPSFLPAFSFALSFLSSAIAQLAVIVAPLFATRVLVPSSAVLIFTRVGLPVSGSIGITFEAWMGASVVTLPPCWLRAWGFVWRVTVLIPSTTTLSSSVRILVILPCLPRSLPRSTLTWSPTFRRF